MENKDCYTCKYNPELCHYTWDECTGNNNAKWRPMGEVKNLTIPCVVGQSEQLCACTEWEGTAEDGTCYECRKPHRDNY